MILTHTKDENNPYPYEVNEEFDIVLSNPPFSVPLDPETKKEHKGRFLFADTRNSEVLFLERYYQLLRPNGRLGCVLPESIFDTAENLSVRLFIYRHFQIWAIISLPYSAFNPFTSTKTCLLFARKRAVEEVGEFDKAWNTAAIRYKRFRNDPIVLWAIQNKRLHDSLMELCVTTDVEYVPKQHLLEPTTITEELHNSLAASCTAGTKAGRKLKSLSDRIDSHFASSPFLLHRKTTREWRDQNRALLNVVTALADDLGVEFKPDSEGLLSRDSFTEPFRLAMARAVRLKDKAGKRLTKKHESSWSKLEKKVDKSLTKEFADVDDKTARDVLLRYLRTLWQPQDNAAPVLAIVERHLDDIAAIGEINDVFGLFPKHGKPAPFAHVNAWWAYNEISEKHDYPIYFGEAEEIGYKRGKKNREQPRRNDLFTSTDPANLYFSIRVGDLTTLLGKVREHVRGLNRKQ